MGSVRGIMTPSRLISNSYTTGTSTQTRQLQSMTLAKSPQLYAMLSTCKVSGLKDYNTIIGLRWPPPWIATGDSKPR